MNVIFKVLNNTAKKETLELLKKNSFFDNLDSACVFVFKFKELENRK